MQPIPQSKRRQNKRAQKLHSSRPRHLERSRVSSRSSTDWSPQHILRRKKTTHRVINQTVNLEEDTQRCHFAPVPKIAADTSTAESANLANNTIKQQQVEVAADIQTGEQYSSTGSINAQKHLATIATSRKKHSLSFSKCQPSSRQRQQLL